MLKHAWLAILCIGFLGCTEPGENSGVTTEPSAPRHPGELTYNRFCFTCHAAGVAGAPRTGDAEAWAGRVAKGHEVLMQSTIEGIAPGMPPMGLCTYCTDEQLSAAIDYMIPGD